LSCLERGIEFPGDDTLPNMAGYLILLLAYEAWDAKPKPYETGTVKLNEEHI